MESKCQECNGTREDRTANSIQQNFYSIVVIKFCKLYHFPDDKNLINFNSSIKIIYKQVNKDLKTLHDWLNANKICLNVSKTEFAYLDLQKNKWTLALNSNLMEKGYTELIW